MPKSNNTDNQSYKYFYIYKQRALSHYFVR